MTQSLSPLKSFSPDSGQVKVWIRRLVWKMSIATFLLMAIGSATRVMNAGLACPDWPLCYGQFVPTQQMNLQVFLEWFHRLDAALIGMSAIALVGLSVWFRNVLPRWLPWASGFALFLIVFQGILGGLTVTELLRFDIVTAHLGTALFFFVTLLTIGACLSDFQGNNTANKLPWIGLTAASLIYLQSLLGGLVASQWALHQCFFRGDMCIVMNTHIIGVVPAALATLAAIVISWRTAALHPLIRTFANIALVLISSQILIGVATFKLHLQVAPLTVTHQAVGAALLGSLTLLTVFALRDRQSSGQYPASKLT
ncbi:cytochrome oxidase assembly [[Leptolyngbya] sp. PCC 7376]|uniref:COX15/CtaA family protein n=1 Tax=[Leptolyngbya] sp. PCC 7376 TaxID=111781 RepID=UPI00029F29C1|nr:heme A synthase [[Leptolyngbya] sp. PCC 7376]AFY38145.1 cytochrome oxidase assembly [[Leptolyngbya] sp. PCC 7376]